jgi:hypothetical protein
MESHDKVIHCGWMAKYSNITETSDLHFKKQPAPSTPTDDGITIACNLLMANAESSIRTRLAQFSNTIHLSRAQPRKPFSLINSVGEEIHKRLPPKLSVATTDWLVITPFITVHCRPTSVTISSAFGTSPHSSDRRSIAAILTDLEI